ncbi:MAG: prepilin peptidase [Deltaproteobacteria bacterium]|nr:prepilin peptidase [Deltaproteobacteria bacterium]
MPEGLVAIAAFLLGACVGSFLNVVIYRLPNGLSIVSPRSHCPSCGNPIPAWLNVPLLSWLILRGRCHVCKAPISVRYLLVELVTALLWLAAVRTFGFSLASLATIVLASGLVAITFIDLDIWEIPDEISLPGILIGGLLRPFAFGAPWYDGVLAAGLGAAFLAFVRWLFLRFRGVEGMGLGDVKLIAMIGAFLGLKALLPVLLVSSVVGSTLGLVLMTARSAEEVPEPPPSGLGDDAWTPPERAIPFGPFLTLGALFHVFFGPAFLHWLESFPSPLSRLL